MNAKDAARYAHVTITTIRSWCRNGSVSATKISGRWDIDDNSLTARVRLAAELRNARRARTQTAIRNRIRDAITLPDLSGTPKQAAWAGDIRAARIERALDLLFADVDLTYLLTAPRPGVGRVDPLKVRADRSTLTTAEANTPCESAAEYVALVNRVLTDDAHLPAQFWINNR